jgi:16S rRNA (cytosine967-C5)-methyltransferase
MTPGARLQAAIELLSAIEADSATPADGVADAYFRARRYMGSKDRRDVADRVFAAIRHRGRLAWWIGQAAPELANDPRAHILVSALLVQREMPSDVIALCNGEGHSPAAITDAEHSMIATLIGRSRNDPAMPAWVRLECPTWIEPLLKRSWGATWEQELEALNGAAPVDLRVNALKGTRGAARRALEAEGLEVTPTPLSPLGLRLAGRANLRGTRAFRDGLVEVQDEGSQLAAILADARPGMAVADLCAGGGGKTLVLAESMGLGRHAAEEGRLVACDISRERLEGLKPRLRRAGIDGVEILVLPAADDPWWHDNRGAFDRVLIDVPCSGSGTWRRNPQARWRLSVTDLAAYIQAQAEIMERAALLVKPKGRLVYVTCSVLRDENEDQVEHFLGTVPGFRTLAADQVWRSVLATSCPAPGVCLRLSPATTGTDGFFVAVLERLR